MLQLVVSCVVETPEQTKISEQGKQEFINWESLANSSWPMGNGNPQCSNRSNSEGPLNGEVVHRFPYSYGQNGITVFDDSTLLFTDQSYLYRVNFYTYDTLWQIGAYRSFCVPLVNKNGNIFIIYDSGNSTSTLAKINENGITKFTFELKGFVGSSKINIDRLGNIYLLDDSKTLYSFDDDCKLIFESTNDNFASTCYGLAFSPDSKTLYIPGSSVTLVAFDIDRQTINWVYGNRKMHCPPVVMSGGEILVYPFHSDKSDSNKITMLSSTGKVLWDYNIKTGSSNSNSPVFDSDGNIYFASNTLYSLSFNGELRWKTALLGECDSQLLSDKFDNIYLAYNNFGNFASLDKIDKNGNTIWQLREFEFIGNLGIGHSMAILPNKMLAVPSWRWGGVYLIK